MGEPLLVEQPVSINPPYKSVMTIKAITDTGVIVTGREGEGALTWGTERPYAWKQTFFWYPGSHNSKIWFEPVRNAKGQVTAARVLVQHGP